MRPAWLVAILAVFGGCGVDDGDPFARASIIERLDDGIGGPKAAARPGDILLENDALRVAIMATRPSMGPGLYGGSIIDADLQWNDARFGPGRGRDQFAELIPTVSMNIPQPVELDDVRIIADGSNGGPAIVRAQGVAVPYLTMLEALWDMLRSPDYGLVTDYIVEPGQPWVTIRTTVTPHWQQGQELATEGAPVDTWDEGMPLMDLAMEDGLVLGDFYLQGGSNNVFIPGVGFDEDGELYEAQQRGENTMMDPFRFAFMAGVADGVSYALAPSDGPAYVPLFTASQTAVVGGGVLGDGSTARFQEGEAFTYERRFFVGHGDVGSVFDTYLEAEQIPYGTISGTVLEASTARPLEGVDVFVYERGATRPWSQWRTNVDPRDDRADGSFGGRLPVGEWELLVRRPGLRHVERQLVEVVEGEEVRVVLEAPRPGVFTFQVRDDWGRDLPSKITIFRTDGESQRDPVLGDGFIGGNPQSVVFSMYGHGEVELPPGEYVAVATRGTVYEKHATEPFRIDDARGHHAEFQLIKSVQTDGWISADLHVHAVPSHDSGVLLADRVRTMVAEGVDFFASSDHDHLTDYAPVIDKLGLNAWVSTAVGTETTTIELGHFLGFPLAIDHLEDAGGAMNWQGLVPGQMLSRLRSQGRSAGHDPALFVAHPRSGILGYFDQYGFNPYGGTPGSFGEPGSPLVQTPLFAANNDLIEADLLSWDFHAMEVLNGKRLDQIRTPTEPELERVEQGEDVALYELLQRTMLEQQELNDGIYRLGYGLHGIVDDWFSLLNLGFRFTALGNSDTHGLTSTEAGCPRNYVFVGEDEPGFVDGAMVAQAVQEHRVVASYGPFIQMWVDGHPIGSDVVPAGQTIEVAVEVQAPTWMAVDRVELYENGTLIQEWEVEPKNGVVRFDESIELEPQKDAWYVAVAMGDDDLSPLFTPVEIPYLELELVVSEALGGIDAVSDILEPAPVLPREYPILPYAITNPIWVDLDGDGFHAPGLPDWLKEPQPPEG